MSEESTSGSKGSDLPGAAPDRLNSWKEIAAYLGKGVRTVQRWETHMGLPIRRLGREGGEIVYALRSEIDAWLLAGGRFRETAAPSEAQEASLEVVGPQPRESAVAPIPAEIPRAPSPAFVTPRWAWSLLILVGLLGTAMTLAQRAGLNGRGASAPNPVGAALEAGVLRAWDGDGKTIWTVPLGAPADARLDTRVSIDPGRDQRRIAVEDLDGDGRNEVLLIALSPSGSSDGVHAFNADGSARFVHRPGRAVTWGSRVYEGFNGGGLYFLREPDGTLSLWVAAAQISWFPSVLERLSPSGRVLSEYWSNGTIRSVRPTTIKGRRFLLIGAYNNEHRGASLAFLDMERANGAAHAEKPDYRCADCGPGAPAEFLVFPGSDILKEATAGEGSAAVTDARLAGDDDVVVTVEQAGTRIPGETEPVSGSLNYTLSARDLRLKQLEVLWGYVKVHRAFEAVGRLKHPFGPAEKKQLAEVLRWSGGRFVSLDQPAGKSAFAAGDRPSNGRVGF